MASNFPHDTLSPASICPVTGLPVKSRSEWTNRAFGSNYRFTIRLIGDRIILNQPSGVAELEDIIGSLELTDAVLREHIDRSMGYLHLSDYSGMQGITRDARKYYIDYMEKRDSMLALIYFNANTLFKVMIKLAKRSSTGKFGVQVVDDYKAAMTLAVHLLDDQTNVPDRGNLPRDLTAGTTPPDQPGTISNTAANKNRPQPSAVQDANFVVHELLRFIGDIDWERHGAASPSPVDKAHPFRSVFDAIALIKEELDAILEKRRLAEKALLESQQCFDEVLKHSRDVLFKRDIRTGAYEYMSDAVSEMMGVCAESVCRKGLKGIKAFIHPEDLPRFLAFHKKLLESDDPKSTDHLVQYRMRDSEGKYHWLSETAAVIRDAEGDPAFVIGSNRDVSRIKALEMERQQMTEQLLRSRKLEAVSTLAGGVAHNFNNLLMIVLGNLELMRMDVPPGDILHRHIDAAEKSAQRAANLSTLMLTYVGQTKISPKAIDLNHAISEMVDVLKTTMANNATITLEPGPGAAWIHADSGKLFQMLSNLVANAVESSGDPPLEIKIRIGLQYFMAAELSRLLPGEHLPEGGYVSLQVADNGCGMDPETIDKVFDPFFTTKFTGRGLGMAAVMGIMRAHHGGAHIDSRINGGTTVTVYFPAHSQRTAMPTPTPATEGYQRTVLLVDDEPLVLELGKQMLRRLGCDVLTAVDGFEALSVFEANRDRIHLAVLDIEMPRMDGRQTLVRLRERGARCPVLVASGFIEAQAREKLRDVQVDGFIQKPFHVNQLHEKIAPLFQLSKK